MRVSELAARAGVSVRMLHHYENAGLLHAVRLPNGYRDFAPSAVGRVQAIRDLLETGFTVAEVLSLAGCLQGSGDGRCGQRTAAIYRQKLVKIEEQLGTLTRLRGTIKERLAQIGPD
jgi:DNA-binding transcriptional MerR regulator